MPLLLYNGGMDNRGIIIDIETGGLDPCLCAVTEIGAIAFCEKDGRLIETAHFHELISPPSWLAITEGAAKVQGSTVQELYTRSGKTERQALADFCGFFWKHLDSNTEYRKFAHRIYAHNAGFDEEFLVAMVERDGSVWLPFADDRTSRFSCTLRLYQQQHAIGLWPEMDALTGGSGSLGKLCEAWGIDRKEPHDALSDCRATLQVLDRLQKRMRG